jgi:hypothetical protein
MNSLVELLADCAKVVCLDHLSKKLFIGSDSKEVLASDIFGLVYMFNAGLNRLPSTKLEDLVDLVIKS